MLLFSSWSPTFLSSYVSLSKGGRRENSTTQGPCRERMLALLTSSQCVSWCSAKGGFQVPSHTLPSFPTAGALERTLGSSVDSLPLENIRTASRILILIPPFPINPRELLKHVQETHMTSVHEAGGDSNKHKRQSGIGLNPQNSRSLESTDSYSQEGTYSYVIKLNESYYNFPAR